MKINGGIEPIGVSCAVGPKGTGVKKTSLGGKN